MAFQQIPLRRAILEVLLIAAGATVDLAPKGLTPLCRAALLGDLRMLQLLIEAGGSVHISSAGDAPLIAAATKGRTACVDLLLRSGADVHVRERRFERSTPLHYAAMDGRTAIVKLLLAHGINIHVEDAEGRSALWFAEREFHEDIADLLTKAGAKTLRQN
jgi:uncharacterized protein